MGKKSSAKEADEAGWGGGAGGDFGDLPDDNSEEEAEEAVPGLEIVDEEGQTVIETPIRYMALRKLKLRIRSELDSEEVGQLTRGDVILATHSQVQNGRTRLRCQRGHPIPGKGRESGWVSTHEASGSVALIAENCENTVYKTAVETATVRQGPDRTCSPIRWTRRRSTCWSKRSSSWRNRPVPGHRPRRQVAIALS